MKTSLHSRFIKQNGRCSSRKNAMFYTKMGTQILNATAQYKYLVFTSFGGMREIVVCKS